MIFDLLVVIIIGLAFWWGYQKGVIYSIFAVLSYFLGAIGAVKFSYLLIKYLKQWTGLSQKPLAIIAFVLVFLMVLVLVKMVIWLLETILKSFSLNTANKIAGGVLHALIGVYLFCVLLWFGKPWNLVPKNEQEMSHTYRYINNIAPDVMKWSGAVVPILKDTYNQFEGLLIDDNTLHENSADR